MNLKKNLENYLAEAVEHHLREAIGTQNMGAYVREKLLEMIDSRLAEKKPDIISAVDNAIVIELGKTRIPIEIKISPRK